MANQGEAAAGQGRGRRRKRAKDRHFMDAALDAFIRDQALRLWRDFEVYRARPDTDRAAALAETGFFADRLAYADLWTKHWAVTAQPAAGLPEGELYGRMEEAVRAAVLEEREVRQRGGDRPLEDLEDFNEFMRRTLNKLLADDPAGGEGRT